MRNTGMTYDLLTHSAVASDIKPSEEVTHLTWTVRNQVDEDEMFQTEETTSKITSSFGYWVLCIPTICHMAHSFKPWIQQTTGIFEKYWWLNFFHEHIEPKSPGGRKGKVQAWTRYEFLWFCCASLVKNPWSPDICVWVPWKLPEIQTV